MPQDKSQVLATYRQLLAKLDQKFSEIHGRHSDKMKCGKGCHTCCVPELTVFSVERENILELIHSTPGLEEKLQKLELENPHKGTRCKFLEANGACAIYEARPVVCRSHGAPLFSKSEKETLLDVCPLNFSDLQNLADLATQDFINLDLINSLLVAINRELDGSGARTKLSLDSLQKA